MKAINSAVRRPAKRKIERDRKRGILNRPVRAMVVGIPNVGKSTFIMRMRQSLCENRKQTGRHEGENNGSV